MNFKCLLIHTYIEVHVCMHCWSGSVCVQRVTCNMVFQVLFVCLFVCVCVCIFRLVTSCSRKSCHLTLLV